MGHTSLGSSVITLIGGEGTIRQCGKNGSTSPCSISMTRSSSVLGTSIAGDSSKSPCSSHFLRLRPLCNHVENPSPKVPCNAEAAAFVGQSGWGQQQGCLTSQVHTLYASMQ